jgi:polyphosphate kinase
LLAAQFNLQQRFIDLIEREIAYAKEGKLASITIKLNNLEERRLIGKLYEASNAGVHINLIVRSICCLVPGVENMSEHITVTRIVDRYLEHGRIFIFHNNGSNDMWLGSSDWMNRNIYRRIEVCFPVYDVAIKEEIMQMIQLQLNDNVQAVYIDSDLNNVAKPLNGEPVQSQQAIAQFLSERENEIKGTMINSFKYLLHLFLFTTAIAACSQKALKYTSPAGYNLE